MPDWLFENGIGEQRAVRLQQGRIVATRMAWPGELVAGSVCDARLMRRVRGSRRGQAQLSDGQEVVVDKLPPSACEGAMLRIAITRAAILEAGRGKPAQAVASDATQADAPTLVEALRAGGNDVEETVRLPADIGAQWDALMAEAFAASVDFDGGQLLFHPTPAMLLVDIDGQLAPPALALAAIAPLADALARFDLGGSVGIDFPTLAGKSDRRAVDAALADALHDWPHERTAMNGFGFVQLVTRLERPSLLHRAQLQRAESAARWLLRKAEYIAGPGAIELNVPPSLERHLRADWLEELGRRTGRPVRIATRAGLAIEAAYPQSVPL